MQGSKIRLSPAEAALFSDAQVILTKNSIIQKTTALLSDVQEALILEAPNFIQETSPSPKISKGENYLGLPYLILDYPRISKGENLFFIRSMFWWGNFFSSTLQLTGEYKMKAEMSLIDSFKKLNQHDYFIGINDDPWIHHFEENNYRKISDLSLESYTMIIEESKHIKIAACWPLNEWDSAANKLIESWKLLNDLVA